MASEEKAERATNAHKLRRRRVRPPPASTVPATQSDSNPVQHAGPDITPLADRQVVLAYVEARRGSSVDVAFSRLSRAGVTVDRICSAREFELMCDDGLPEAVVVDIDMPNGEGVATLETLAGWKYQGPVVLGASSQPRLLPTTSRLAQGMGLRIVGSIALPCSADTLLDLLRPAFVVEPPRKDPELTVTDLHQAFMRDEIEPFFQPLVDSRSLEVHGAEALARWRHPIHGIVRPDLFINLAEETKLMGPLTEVILAKSARACKSWREQGWDMSVAVNVSASSLVDHNFCHRATEIVHQIGVPTSAIKLEVTESVAMDMSDKTEEVLHYMRAQGFLLALDDFGTGHSSLVSLHRMPFDVLKVDKSFVDNLSDDRDAQIIVRALINLSHDLNLKVVAEGVEDEHIVRRLQEYGADYLQGYYYSRPLPAREFEHWVRKMRNSRFV